MIKAAHVKLSKTYYFLFIYLLQINRIIFSMTRALFAILRFTMSPKEPRAWLYNFDDATLDRRIDMFQISVSSSSQSSRSNSSPHMTLEELRAINKYAEATKSLSYLPQVCFHTQ